MITVAAAEVITEMLAAHKAGTVAVAGITALAAFHGRVPATAMITAYDGATDAQAAIAAARGHLRGQKENDPMEIKPCSTAQVPTLADFTASHATLSAAGTAVEVGFDDMLFGVISGDEYEALVTAETAARKGHKRICDMMTVVAAHALIATV